MIEEIEQQRCFWTAPAQMNRKNLKFENLPKDRTEGTAAFQVVGVHFARPLKYRKEKKNEAKAYIMLYACSLTQGIYLELSPNMETKEFISSLERSIA